MCVRLQCLISVARCSLLLELKATGGVTVEREALMSCTCVYVCVCVCRVEFPTPVGNSTIFEADGALCRSFRTCRELRMASRPAQLQIKGGKTFFVELDGIFKSAAVPFTRCLSEARRQVQRSAWSSSCLSGRGGPSLSCSNCGFKMSTWAWM